MLRPLRRLRYALLPLYAATLLAFVARLGWAHDPTCPHHRGHAGSSAADAAAYAPASRASHAAQLSHAGHTSHAAHATHGAEAPVAEAPPAPPNAKAPADSSKHSGDGDCRCLDPACCLSGVVAVLDADTGDPLTAEVPAFDAAARPMPVSVVRPGAYSTHRLPFPHAPPGIDGLT